MLRCGLVGEKLGHSYSPQIHALLGAYSYRLVECTADRLGEILHRPDWDGYNVTIPHKKAVAGLCDALSPAAAALGSVNTLIRRKDGSIYGENTDVYGLQYLLHTAGICPRGKRALVLGSGGAGVTACAVLRQAGAEVTVISRTGADNYTNLQSHRDAQLICNATPVGMYPGNGASPVDLALFPRCEGVIDLIYNPARTALLLQAERMGIPCRNGLPMLVAQAARSSELFTGRPIAGDTVQRIIRQIQAEQENIVLIGMPGCGKSSVAAAVAAALQRPLADTDALLQQQTGKTVAEIFSSEGEAGFRQRESALLAQLGKGSGKVISTGGGCVTRPENCDFLHQNGIIIWLQRPLPLLETAGRPLSGRVGVETLYEQRKALYQSFADVQVENASTVQAAAARILQIMERSGNIGENSCNQRPQYEYAGAAGTGDIRQKNL